MRHGWNPADDVNPAASSLFEGRKDWVDVLTAHVQMLRFVCRGETEQACEHTEALVTPFNKVSEPLLCIELLLPLQFVPNSKDLAWSAEHGCSCMALGCTQLTF